MQGRLSKLFMAAGAAATLTGGAMIPRPASADTTSTILTAAAALGAVILYNNYEHKRAEANTIVGYTRNGGQVYGDGRIVMPNGTTFYPNGNGGYTGPNGQTIYGVNNAYNNGYYNHHAYAGSYAYGRGYVSNAPVYYNRTPVYVNRAPAYVDHAPAYDHRNDARWAAGEPRANDSRATEIERRRIDERDRAH